MTVRARYARARPILTMQDRILVGSYLRHTAIVLTMLATIAVAIDTASWIARVGAAATQSGQSPLVEIGRFLGLRALDNGIQTLPIAAILGFIWTEISYHVSGHRLVDRITGRTEARAMRSILITALAIASCQTVLDNVVRPYAVETMIRERMAFWTRYTEFSPHRPVWIAADGAIVTGMITHVGASELRDVTLYRFDGNRVTSIARGTALSSGGMSDDAGTPLWSLEGASTLDLSKEAPLRGVETPPSDEELVVPFAVDPGWLPLAPIKPVYLTLPELVAMARLENLPDGAPNYVSWLLGRLTAGMTLGLICAFIAIFFRGSVARFGLAITVLVSVAFGYGGLLGMRMLRVIAQYSTVSPLVVAAIIPLLLATAVVVAFRRSAVHDKVTR